MAIQNRMQYLSALRGFASLWVVLVHVAMMPQPRLPLPDWFDIYIKSGTMGVDLFFVVSAFSLCLTMPKHENEQRPLVGFATRRFFRIAPLFYVMILFTAFSNPAGFVYSWKTILANMLFIFNFIRGHGYQTSVVLAGWTIGVEMAFYMMFPFIYSRTKSIYKSLIALLISLAVAKVFFMVIPLFTRSPGEYNLYSIFYRLPVFMFGIVAFYLLPIISKLDRSREIGGIFLASVPVQFFAVITGNVPFFDAYYWSGLMFLSLLIGFALCPLAPFVNRITARLGDISFSIYMIHSPVIVALFPVYRWIQGLDTDASHGIATFAMCVGVTLAIVLPLSELIFRFFESPLNERGRKLASKWAGGAVSTYKFHENIAVKTNVAGGTN